MPYMTLGSRGQVTVDPFTQSAQEIFDLDSGLGKKKKSFFKKITRVVKKAISLTPAAGVLNLARMAKKAMQKKKTGVVVVQEGGATPAYDPALYAQQPPVGTQYSYPPAPVGTQYSYPPPSVDSPYYPPQYPEGPQYPPYSAPSAYQAAQAAASPPYAPSYADAGPGYEYQYSEAPQRTGEGYTIGPGEEPWAQGGMEYDEEGGAPETSVEGGCGGYILSAPSPAQRSSEHGRRNIAPMLGQDEDFWFKPSPEFGEENRPRPTDWPPSDVSVHRGSKVWGDALIQAMTISKRRRGMRRGRMASSGLPF